MSLKSSILVGVICVLALDPVSAIVVHRRFYTPSAPQRKALPPRGHGARSALVKGRPVQEQKRDSWKCYWFGEECSEGDINYAASHKDGAPAAGLAASIVPSASASAAASSAVFNSDDTPTGTTEQAINTDISPYEAFNMEAMIKAHPRPSGIINDAASADATSAVPVISSNSAATPAADESTSAPTAAPTDFAALNMEQMALAHPRPPSTGASASASDTPASATEIGNPDAGYVSAMSSIAAEWESLAQSPEATATSAAAYAMSSLAAEWESLASSPQVTGSAGMAMSSLAAEWESLANGPQATQAPSAMSSIMAEWKSLAAQPTDQVSQAATPTSAYSEQVNAAGHAYMSASAFEWQSAAASPAASAPPTPVSPPGSGGESDSMAFWHDLFPAQGDGSSSNNQAQPDFMAIWNSIKQQQQAGESTQANAFPPESISAAWPAESISAKPEQPYRRDVVPTVTLGASLAASTAAVDAYYQALAILQAADTGL